MEKNGLVWRRSYRDVLKLKWKIILVQNRSKDENRKFYLVGPFVSIAENFIDT